MQAEIKTWAQANTGCGLIKRVEVLSVSQSACLRQFLTPHAKRLNADVSIWSGSCSPDGLKCGYWSLTQATTSPVLLYVEKRATDTLNHLDVCETGKEVDTTLFLLP